MVSQPYRKSSPRSSSPSQTRYRARRSAGSGNPSSSSAASRSSSSAGGGSSSSVPMISARFRRYSRNSRTASSGSPAGAGAAGPSCSSPGSAGTASGSRRYKVGPCSSPPTVAVNRPSGATSSVILSFPPEAPASRLHLAGDVGEVQLAALAGRALGHGVRQGHGPLAVVADVVPQPRPHPPFGRRSGHGRGHLAQQGGGLGPGSVSHAGQPSPPTDIRSGDAGGKMRDGASGGGLEVLAQAAGVLAV